MLYIMITDTSPISYDAGNIETSKQANSTILIKHIFHMYAVSYANTLVHDVTSIIASG